MAASGGKAIALAKAPSKPLVAEDLDFSAKKKSLGQLNSKSALMLSGLLYAKYRQQFVAPVPSCPLSN